MKKNKNDKTIIIKKQNTPYFPLSRLSMRENRTGSWRYLAPTVQNKTSPCEATCPLAIPISDFIYELENNNIDNAARILRYENPLPAVCGRVCVHPCEDACYRASFDRSIAIHMLERYAGDHFSPKMLPQTKIIQKRIAVIGAGPAGLAAAYFLLLTGYQVTIFEARDELGGTLRYGIPEYRMPLEILNRAIDDMLTLKPEIKTGMELGKNLSIEDLNSYDAIFIGTGAGGGKKFTMDSGETDGIISGLELLNWIKTGRQNKIANKVIIIGGGNTAIDVARSALRLGKKPVILYRREIEDMPAFTQEVREAVREGVIIKPGVLLKEIIKTDNSIVGVKCIRATFEKSSSTTFHEIKGSDFYLEADQVISATGELPDLSILPDELNIQSGKVFIDKFGRTDIPNIFAGGDLVSQPHLVVYALASGKRAAVSIDSTINGFDLEEVFSTITVGNNGISFKNYMELKSHLLKGEHNKILHPAKICDSAEINYDYFNPSERTRESKLSLAERSSSFKEVHSGYNIENANLESMRCFHCGKCTLCGNCYIYCPDISILVNLKANIITVDYDFCKGCGICSEECPRGVIQMKREVIK